MPDYAQLQADRDEQEERHYHAANDFKNGYDAFLAGQPRSAMLNASQNDGWNAARDAAITMDRKQQRESDGDILFA